MLVDSVAIEGEGERAERAAYREAEKPRTKLLSDADELKIARTKATVGALLDRCHCGLRGRQRSGGSVTMTRT